MQAFQVAREGATLSLNTHGSETPLNVRLAPSPCSDVMTELPRTRHLRCCRMPL